MCAASDLAMPLIEWLELLIPSPPSQVTNIIRNIIAGDQDGPSLGDLLDRLGLSERTVRAWFAASLLPSPGQWLSLTRVLPRVMRLQREPDVPLLTVAIESGYSDHSALIATLRRLFGATPRIIRSTIGWEWLVLRFVERHARGVPRSSGV
jgi:AraC-like DNA-binding protein